MSITTKKGDKGFTCLCGGSKVAKDDIRMDICGSLDELNSFLGVSKVIIKTKNIKLLIESIQKDLFVIGSEIATPLTATKRLKNTIKLKSIQELQQHINSLENKKVIKDKCFSLSGGNLASSSLDVARTIARRLERRVVTLNRRKLLKNRNILVYLNRLSDLLYLLARKYAK